ncbi:thioredoxin domain-containing protein [Aquicella lusitana]|uniref:Spermatogenesis-associated protein 20-like TRX domain-containing protein n=1 Tax=Aquicella lusitana TaxID=254246 RepID=A0A370G9Y2_9COXI|nr:thioredoxin domain-containing protein [Aquicella lusitana]RDI39829.1 hypothetical protein C8D86_1261 [Aquicella lusitana]VVC73150.1 hypothetical protein AQULUS_08810 [Aquicella lusitana]
MTNIIKINRLAQASSPYLRQHAQNPVEWYPWGEEALETARRENKPILLSIGYAACHWCHVMAHESFEDPVTADLMNQLFINIKVDREERPDLDKIYQTAHYLLTQQNGGWPLTIFLTPGDLTPFFSGTYFPREQRYQLPAFKDVLRAIAQLYQQRREDIQQQNTSLRNILHQSERISADETICLDHAPVRAALKILEQHYDPQHGGFNGAPKFPQAPKLAFLLDENPIIVANTLHHMMAGGIYDQLESGFYRYSVDNHWHIPHFEKMLYDNAQLLTIYALASERYSESSFALIAHEIAQWTLGRMQSEEGGYFASIDADSEGHEGKFYIWDKTEVQSILNQDEYAVAQQYLGLDHPPNFEKHWHLYQAKPLSVVAEELGLSLTAADALLLAAKTKLLSARNTRVPPALDQKMLTSWNSLMIKGMLTAGTILQKKTLIDAAERALSFIREHLWQNNRLLASYNTHLAGYLDDYAFLIDALLCALETSWDSKQLHFAVELADTLLEHFMDEQGGFFFTADDHEQLLYRPKTMMDEATPSGNGIAAQVLLRLGWLLAEPRYIDAAEKTLRSAWPVLSQFPAEHCTLLSALRTLLDPPKIIIIRGPESDIERWRVACRNPHHQVFAIPSDAQQLPDALAEKRNQEKTRAYICQGMQCQKPIESLDLLLSQIHQT